MLEKADLWKAQCFKEVLLGTAGLLSTAGCIHSEGTHSRCSVGVVYEPCLRSLLESAVWTHSSKNSRNFIAGLKVARKLGAVYLVSSDIIRNSLENAHVCAELLPCHGAAWPADARYSTLVASQHAVRSRGAVDECASGCRSEVSRPLFDRLMLRRPLEVSPPKLPSFVLNPPNHRRAERRGAAACPSRRRGASARVSDPTPRHPADAGRRAIPEPCCILGRPRADLHRQGQSL